MASSIDPTKPQDRVPAQKSDLRANLAAAKAEIEALQAGTTDAMHARPELRAYRETCARPAAAANALTLDLAEGNVFEVTLDQNVSALILANPPSAGLAGSLTLILRQDETGGRTLEWPPTVRWPGGVAPTLSSRAAAVDIYSLLTVDGGATWYGFIAGQGFA
jgi:hypothetical protein